MRALPVFVLALLAAAPFAVAHGTAEASELEVEVLADEGNDLNNARGGWDITQAFLGEAHEHALGQGATGDGVYWRVELYGVPGSPNPLATGEWRAELTFDTKAGPVTRTLRTTDGKAFTSDFDLLRVNVSDGIVHVERALVLLENAGLVRGDVLSGFRIATYVGNELRDRAPGGIPVAGPVETPAEDGGAAEYAVRGPTGYANATILMQEGAPTLRVLSLLKKGEQHIHLHLPPGVTSHDPSSVSLKPGAAATFRLDMAGARIGDAFDVTTDIGGRVSVRIGGEDGRPALAVEDAEAVPVATPAPAKNVPVPSALLVVLVLVLAPLVRRR